ncbi:hypothetical protein [Actinomyces wuliandei]|uniref:hypothetical protein n=1 Tax=Actinomyces wuliandei TaxID=2057743 RepID=UPI000FDA18B1|nr:hypothetical protein [Actinomyces wuliandei]
MEGLRRRSLVVLGAAGAAVLAGGGCSSGPEIEVPQGWRRVSAGSAAFNVPQEWQEVTIPEEADVGSWDWAMQDVADWDDESVGCRLLVMTHGAGDFVDAPPDNAEDMALELSLVQVFGGGIAGPPYEVEGPPDQLWRMDHRLRLFSQEDKEDKDHVLVAQDEGRPEIAIIGLSGPGVDEELMSTFTAGIEVLHD